MDTATAVWWAVQAGARLGLAARQWYLDQLAGQAVVIPAMEIPEIGITSAIDFFEGDGRAVLAIDAGLAELHRLALLGLMDEHEQDPRWLSYRRAYMKGYSAATEEPAGVVPEARFVLATLKGRPARWASHASLAAEALRLAAEYVDREPQERARHGWVFLSATVAQAIAEAMTQASGDVANEGVAIVRTLLRAAATVMLADDDWLMQIEHETLRTLLREQVLLKLGSSLDADASDWDAWALDVWARVAETA